MICPYCAKENPENTQFCNYCGGPIVIPAEQPVPETPPVEPQIPDIQTPTVSQEINPVTSQPPPKPTGGIFFGNKIWWFSGCFLVVIILLGCGAIIWALFNYSNRLPFINPASHTPTFPAVATEYNAPVIVPSHVPNMTPPPEITVPADPVSSTPAVIFSDDFSDPGSGWDQIDEADYFSDYYENSYRIVVNSDMSDSWANPGSKVFGDVRIEVDATRNAGPEDNDFGLICRYQSVNEFYYGVISSDGYFGITKVTSESSALLGRDSLEFSDAINQGSAMNHIRFDCVGNVLTLYVNGQQVDQQTDANYSSGNVGLIAGTYDTSGTDILFDNFFVYQP